MENRLLFFEIISGSSKVLIQHYDVTRSLNHYNYVCLTLIYCCSPWSQHDGLSQDVNTLQFYMSKEDSI